MTYTYQGVTYPKRVGTREEVYHGLAFSTGKGASSLIKEDLILHGGVYLTVRQYNAAIKKASKAKDLTANRSTGIPKVGNRQQVMAGRLVEVLAAQSGDDLGGSDAQTVLAAAVQADVDLARQPAPDVGLGHAGDPLEAVLNLLFGKLPKLAGSHVA